MNFFDKLKDVIKKAGTKIQEEAKKQTEKMKDRRNAEKMLKTLKKSDLQKFCDEYGINIKKSMTAHANARANTDTPLHLMQYIKGS
jgi:transposase-like protein